jgi:glycosyltransferase involved in cell wall biosynthesis
VGEFRFSFAWFSGTIRAEVQTSRPKVILDIGFLGHAHDERSARRGAQRVAGNLFAGLRASGTCDLSFVATSHLAGAFDFLAAQKISPAEKLRCGKFQLQRSRFARPLREKVLRSMPDRRLPMRAWRRFLSEIICAATAGEAQLADAMLADADIYHTPHTPFPAAVRRHPRLKKFITLHDFIPLKTPAYFTGNTHAFMDAVVGCLTPENFAFCVSEVTRTDALNFSKIPPEHVFVAPLAADKSLFHPESDAEKVASVCRRLAIPTEPYFLALSAQDRHKNFPHLIRCFGQLVESGGLTDTNLVIVGPNPDRNAEVVDALAKFPRVRARVIVPGYVADEDLASLYSGATAFLFPSLAEGFGIPPLEAMQCGTPVIASNTTSIPEVVGDAGILLSPTDEDSWCQAMLQINRESTLRTQLRQKSLERSKLFSWERFIAETLRGYRTAIGLT